MANLKKDLPEVYKYIRKQKVHRKWTALVTAAAIIVSLGTVHQLILPAKTMDKDTAVQTPGVETAAETAKTAVVAEKEGAAPAEQEDLSEKAQTPNSAEAVQTKSADDAILEQQTEETSSEQNVAPDTSEKQAAAEANFKAGTVSFHGSDYTVTADYGSDAGFADGVQLSVREISRNQDADSYHNYCSQALRKLQNEKGDSAALKTARFFDITFLAADGTVIEPKAAVNMKITYDNPLDVEKSSDVDAVHFDKNEGLELVEVQTDAGNDGEQVKEISFSADSFSVYGIVETSLQTEFQISNQNGEDTTYLVTVTYGKDANIPEGSTLRVAPYSEGSKDYEYAKKAVLASKQENGEKVSLSGFGFVAMDVSIIGPDGKEIEPDAPVRVNFKIKSLPNVDDIHDVLGTLEIQHHVETPDGIVVDTVYDGDSAEPTFDVATDEEAIAAGKAVDPDSYVGESDTKSAEEDFETSFEADVFSTYSINYYYGYGQKNIHYVDTAGNELTPTMTPNFNNLYAFLVYDIEGYDYVSTHRGARNGPSIAPLLRASNETSFNGSVAVRYSTGTRWVDLPEDDVYVVYEPKKQPTTGGKVTPSEDEEWPEGDDAPHFSKTSLHNGNGTNNISLSIKAAEKDIQDHVKANVVVVFDVSGSMSTRLSGNTRLAAGKEAINHLADTLLSKRDAEGNPLVKMGLVSFSTTAQTNVSISDPASTNLDAYKGVVNRLSANGGTNWEQALRLANQMTVDSDAVTYVVFVTDGDPTFRISRGNVSDSELDNFSEGSYQYYRNNSVFGEGNADTKERNFDAAVNEVRNILSNNKNFYAIGVSNDVQKVTNLVTEGGGSADHAFLATDTAGLTQAFDSIASSINSKLGFGNIEVTDGVTSLTNAEMKVMQTVDPGSFKYYRYGGKDNKYGADEAHKTEWTTRAADGCAAADYNKSKGAVEWNMGDTFQLEDGVTYVVEFTVWPSQGAYDLIADLNNGKRTFSELTAAEKAQVVEVKAPVGNEIGKYALKTNTDEVNATYQKTTKSGDKVSVSGEEKLKAVYHEKIEDMALTSDFITIKKEWNNKLDERSASGLELTVTKDGKPYLEHVKVNPANGWTSGKEYISAGFITTKAGGGYVVREKGHDYTIIEPEEFEYYWELTAPVYRPMVVDGELQLLIKTDEPEGTDGKDYYTIEGKTYQVKTGANAVTATNDRRSVLDLTKEIAAEEDAVDIPDPDALFTYTVSVTDADGKDVYFSAQDSSGATVEIQNRSPNVTAEVKEGKPTGYYYVPSGESFTIAIKARWHVRFINLPTGTTYSIAETGKGEDKGFQFVQASAKATNGGTPGTVSQETVRGSIEKTNNEFDVTYTNKWLTKQIQIIKVDEKGNKLSGAKFSLAKGPSEIARFTSSSEQGELINLGKGTYCLTEMEAPNGYVILSNKIYFAVNADGSVALSNEEGQTQITGADGNFMPVSYENVSISNQPGAPATITVKNTPGTVLPNTGGSGTLLYTLGGLMLAIISVMMFGFRMRRRRKEDSKSL